MTMRTLLPPEVVVVEAEDWMWSAPLHPTEADSVVHAVERRQREFAAGRTCARIALEKLGVRHHPVRSGPDRAPQWPNGIVGSITHCEGYCAAVVGPQAQVLGLGIDAEEATPLAEAEAELICSRSELVQAAKSSLYAALLIAKVIFSAKESFYKCYYPLVGRFLEFSDVEVSVIDDGRFVAELVNRSVPDLLGRRRCQGRFTLYQRHIFSAVVLCQG